MTVQGRRGRGRAGPANAKHECCKNTLEGAYFRVLSGPSVKCVFVPLLVVVFLALCVGILHQSAACVVVWWTTRCSRTGYERNISLLVSW